jgi:hypothetical protein
MDRDDRALREPPRTATAWAIGEPAAYRFGSAFSRPNVDCPAEDIYASAFAASLIRIIIRMATKA